MNGQPKYLQIEHDLIRQIEMGILHPDDVVPTETELIASYGASRITVRHALDDLAAGGYIRRVQGKGTYVNRPSVRGLSNSAHLTKRTGRVSPGFCVRG